MSLARCTAALNLWTDRFSFVTTLFVTNSVGSEAPLPQGYLAVLLAIWVEGHDCLSP